MHKASNVQSNAEPCSRLATDRTIQHNQAKAKQWHAAIHTNNIQKYVNRLKNNKDVKKMTGPTIILKDEVKLISNLNKIFSVNPDVTEQLKAPELENKMYMSECNIYAIVCKTEQARNIFIRFTNKNENKLKNIPELNYTRQINTEIKSKYSYTQLMKLIKIFDNYESIILSLDRDSPLIIENPHFKIYLAPRIED